MTEIRQRSKTKGLLFSMFFIASIGIGISFFIRGCSSDTSPDLANIVLQTGGRTFLYTGESKAFVLAKIKNDETPPVFGSLEVYKDDGAFYVNPMTMKPLVDVLAGNVEFHPKKEINIEGYMTSGDGLFYSMESHYKSTGKIGMQITENTIELTNGRGKKQMIKWTLDASEGTARAIKNCEVKSFWIETRPSPGETVFSTKDFVVISVDKLAEFFNRNISYDPEGKLCKVQ